MGKLIKDSYGEVIIDDNFEDNDIRPPRTTKTLSELISYGHSSAEISRLLNGKYTPQQIAGYKSDYTKKHRTHQLSKVITNNYKIEEIKTFLDQGYKVIIISK